MRKENQYKVGISAIFLLVAGAWIVRIQPFMGFSPIRGVFFANNFYGMVYIVENGHTFHVGSLNINSLVGRNVYSSSADPFRSIFGAILAIITGHIKSPEEIAGFLTIIPWQGIILFPFSSVLAYKICRTSINVGEIIILALITMFGSYQVIYLTNTGTSNAAIGWSFILIALWCLYKLEVDSRKGRYHLLLLISFISILEWYHTAAIVFLFIVFVFTIPLRKTVEKNPSFSIKQFLIYNILFVIHFQLVASTYFIGYTMKIISIATNLAQGSTETTVEEYKYLAETASPLSVQLASIGAMTIVAIIIAIAFLFMFRKWAKKRKVSLVEILVIRYALVIPIIGVPIFLSFGPTLAIFRMFQYGYIILPLIVGILFTNYLKLTKLNYNTVMTIALLVFISISLLNTYTYLGTPTRESGLIEENEVEGAKWLKSYSFEGGVVFTDYRLAPALLVHDYFKISIVWPREAKLTNNEMKSIYYSKSGKAAVGTIQNMDIKGNSPDYLFISEKMTDRNIGVNSNGKRFRALSEKEYDKFKNSAYFNHIADMGKASIYRPRY